MLLKRASFAACVSNEICKKLDLSRVYRVNLKVAWEKEKWLAVIKRSDDKTDSSWESSSMRGKSSQKKMYIYHLTRETDLARILL